MNEMKLTGESKDIVLDNILKLKEIFPDVFNEDKIDFDKLKLDLGEYIDDSHEKYNFTWPGKSQAIRESQKQSTGTLRPCKEESKNWETTQNLYIEGDNLEVLKLLQKAYYNKIKCIYIDPPYNTGKDFIYTDNYQDNLGNYLKISGQALDSKGNKVNHTIKLTNNPETNGRYHSNWLNMMYSRLKLARNLLKDNGIIFISIDDNEVFNLKKICDEIFGEENFISSFIWQKKSSGGQHSNHVLDFHEYILLYQKNRSSSLSLLVERTDEQKKSFKYSDEFEKTRGKYLISPLKSWLDYRPTLIYDIVCPDGTKLNTQWICSEPTFNQLKNEGRILFKQNSKGDWSVYKKQYVNEKGGLVKPASLITNHGQTAHGKRDLKKLFDKDIMSFPKPVELIRYLISMIDDETGLILDFFSGSSTTSQAIFENNVKSVRKNKFIMIQIPEETDEKSEANKEGYDNICEIGKERIRRAGDKIVEESGNKDLDIGFKVFKLDSSNLKKWDPDYNNIQQSLTIDSIKKGRTNEDLVYEIMLKYGIDLTLPIEKHDNIYSIGFGALVICLDDNISKDITNSILEFTKDSSTSRVVFKDSGFKSDADKTNIKEILKTNNIDEFITI